MTDPSLSVSPSSPAGLQSLHTTPPIGGGLEREPRPEAQPGHRNRFNRWAITGPCVVCGIAVSGWLDAEHRPRHPDCLTDAMRAQAAEPLMLTTAPIHQRCPHCQAAVIELWLHGLFTRLDPAPLTADQARAALLSGRELYRVNTIGPGNPLTPVGAPVQLHTGHQFLAAHPCKGETS